MKDEISGALKDRLSSNILGTFTLFYMTLNWKFFVYVFSSMEAKLKIESAKAILCEEFWCNLILSFVFTGFVLFILPFLKVWYDKFYFKRQAESELVKQKNQEYVQMELKNINNELQKMAKTRDMVNSIVAGLQNSSQRIDEMDKKVQAGTFSKKDIEALKANNNDNLGNATNLLNKYSDFKKVFDEYVNYKNQNKK